MTKNLIGVCNNINNNLQKIKVWSRSFYKACPDGKVTLLCADASQDELQACESLNIRSLNINVCNHETINHQRLLHIKEALETHFNDNDLFMSTDVFDVVFQADPFEKFDLLNYEVFVGEEGVKVHEEPWNFRNISALFPDALNECLQFPVINSGVIGGTRNALIHLYNRLYALCESSSAETIRDQAGLHVMLARNEVPKVKIFNIRDAWAIHCAIAGPTAYFESWGFKSRLIESNTPIPYMEDNIIKVSGQEASIVHQFNRCDWNNTLISPYIF